MAKGKGKTKNYSKYLTHTTKYFRVLKDGYQLTKVPDTQTHTKALIQAQKHKHNHKHTHKQ